MDSVQRQLHQQWLRTPQTQDLCQTLEREYGSLINQAIGFSVTNQELDLIRMSLNRAYEIRETLKLIREPAQTTEQQ